MKKILIHLAKLGVSVAILGWLFYQSWNDESFAALWEQPKHWGLLTVAWVVAMTAICMTFFRWYLLVRGLHLPFTASEAFRLGFLGFLMRFLTLGDVGGDLLKAVFLAHRQPGRRTEAVASVVVDRLVGMYALFLVAATATFFFQPAAADLRSTDMADGVALLSQVVRVVAVVGTVGIGVVLLPGFTTGPLSEMFTSLPKIGPTIGRVIGAVRIYRGKLGLMSLTLAMSLVGHSMFAVCIYLTARGLPGNHPSLAAHFVIVPIALVSGALPLPGGLGAWELALDVLYRVVSSTAVPARQGFIVALAFRVMTIVIAMVGMGYYLAGRREVDELIREAEHEEEMSKEQAPMSNVV